MNFKAENLVRGKLLRFLQQEFPLNEIQMVLHILKQILLDYEASSSQLRLFGKLYSFSITFFQHLNLMRSHLKIFLV
jgi:hypothetical protein